MLRPQELWAAHLMRCALPGVEVNCHDDGSQPAMCDLDLIQDSVPFGAAEITAAADAAALELHQLMVDSRTERWINPALAGAWTVVLRPDARAKQLKRALPEFLARLHALGLESLQVSAWSTDPLVREAHGLGVRDAHHGPSDYPGAIYPLVWPEEIGGFVPDDGEALPEWLSDWATDPEQTHSVRKLAGSNHSQRHLFIIVPGFTTAPFRVVDLLVRRDAPLPLSSPRLPNDVTHVWAVSTWAAGRGMRWSADRGWNYFEKDDGTS